MAEQEISNLLAGVRFPRPAPSCHYNGVMLTEEAFVLLTRMTEKNYKGRKYLIQKYDPHWVTQFETEKGALETILGNHTLAIEHIGSTAVPNLAGKPTIDILAIIENIGEADGYQEQLEPLGYKFLGQYVSSGSRLYVKEKDNLRLVNLHFFKQGHPHIAEMLRLRDYFRAHPKVVEEYSNLKFELAKKYSSDYGFYRKHKDEWMNALKAKIGLA